MNLLLKYVNSLLNLEGSEDDKETSEQRKLHNKFLNSNKFKFSPSSYGITSMSLNEISIYVDNRSIESISPRLTLSLNHVPNVFPNDSSSEDSSSENSISDELSDADDIQNSSSENYDDIRSKSYDSFNLTNNSLLNIAAYKHSNSSDNLIINSNNISHNKESDNNALLNVKKLFARENFINLLKQISILPPTYIIDSNSIFNKWITSDEMLEHFKLTSTEIILNLNIAGIVTILEDNNLLQEIMSIKPELIFQTNTNYSKVVNPSKFCSIDIDLQIHLLTLPLMIAIDFVNVDLTKTILSNKEINREFISLIKECSDYAEFTYGREIYQDSFTDEYNQTDERYINQKVIKYILSKSIIQAENSNDKASTKR